MFDALKLLGSLAENHLAPSASNRFGNAVQQGSGSGGLLQQVLGQLGGAQAGNPAWGAPGAGGPAQAGVAPGAAAQGGLGGLLGNFAQMAQRAATAPRQEVQGNNPVALGGLGSLAGALLGGGRGAIGGGLMAVLGSLAYSALQSQQGSAAAGPARGGPAPAPGGGGWTTMPGSGVPERAAAPMPATDADAQRRAMLMVRAMIQAAKADGTIDEQETKRILGTVDAHGHDPEARSFITNEMRRPIDIGDLVRDVGSPQEAAEVYAASLMAIELDSQAERDYLSDLARALQLPTPVITRIHQTFGMMT